MRITNMKKFIRGIVLVVIIPIAVIFIFSNNIALSHGEVQYKERYIDVGDTLWEIANSEKSENEYYMNKDVREIIKDIKQLNNLNSSALQVGQELEIPTL